MRIFNDTVLYELRNQGKSIQKQEEREEMTIQCTDEQIALKELASEFFDTEVRPVMAELDARPDPKDCYPLEIVRKGSQIGLRTSAISEEDGGEGLDF